MTSQALAGIADYVTIATAIVAWVVGVAGGSWILWKNRKQKTRGEQYRAMMNYFFEEMVASNVPMMEAAERIAKSDVGTALERDVAIVKLEVIMARSVSETLLYMAMLDLLRDTDKEADVSDMFDRWRGPSSG